jgi:hypothetical protein
MTMAANNWSFIIAAYAAAWLAVTGYWIFAHSTLRLARERYERALASAGRAEGSSR